MTTSVAFVDNSGHVLFQEKLSDGNGDAMPIYSIAKTFIASAICLSEIDLQAPITTWIDPSLLPDAADITVHHLLNHSSGLIDYGGLREYQQAVTEVEPPWSDDEFAARTLQQPLMFTPGTHFAYSNPGYWLLKKILEHEHDKSWAVVLTDLITGPLQLGDTRVVHGIGVGRAATTKLDSGHRTTSALGRSSLWLRSDGGAWQNLWAQRQRTGLLGIVLSLC
jgi:CubicO group peptidase (beta-lactamase class C family)